ncbi:MAG: dihydroorotase [Oscillospiraceae bacterium]|nr:dihydroorotase [Oscillospiraceae bacterium]
MGSVLLKNITVTDSKGTFKADILIENGIIASLEGKNADIIYDCSSLTAMAGLFDMHVHLRDPGFTHKEDILTGCSAALAGGVTGVAAMPNTKPAADNPETVRYIIDKAKNTGVKVYPVGSITKGLQGRELCDFDSLKEAGICAVSDDGRPVENAEMMREALVMAAERNIPVISHCEDLSIINGGIINKGDVALKLGVPGMDRASEDYITAREMILAHSAGVPIHIAHVSTKGSVAMIRFAKSMGVKVTCETCPHYFLMTEEKVSSMDADYRMNPPLRTEEDRKAILEGILDGTIDCIVTDHAPHTPEEKADFYRAPNGVIGMETSLAATLTLYHEGKLTLSDIARLMSERPREILSLPKVKIAVGEKADMCIMDTEYKWTVDPCKLHSKARNAVFKGMEFTGKPVMTIAEGEIRYKDEDYKFTQI